MLSCSKLRTRMNWCEFCIIKITELKKKGNAKEVWVFVLNYSAKICIKEIGKNILKINIITKGRPLKYHRTYLPSPALP